MTKPKHSEQKLRDRDRARALVIESARKLFSTRGFEGARLSDIARNAGVSTTLIYHYFNNKDALFSEALNAEILNLRIHQQDVKLRDLAPLEAISRLTETTFDYFSENQQLVNFLNIENRLGGIHIRESKAAVNAYGPLLNVISEILNKGEEQGVIRPGIDAMNLYLSISGMCFHYSSNRYTLGAVFQQDFSKKSLIANRRTQIIDFVLHSVKA